MPTPSRPVVVRANPERGVSLIELIAAVAVISILLAGLGKVIIGSSEQRIKSDLRQRQAAVLEEATEAVHASQSWTTCGPRQVVATCPIQGLDTKTREGGDRDRFTARMTVHRSGATSTVDIQVTSSGSDNVTPAVASFTIDGNTVAGRGGTLLISSCRVNQVDDRMATGTCPTNGSATSREMAPPGGIPESWAWDPAPSPWGWSTQALNNHSTNIGNGGTPELYQWYNAKVAGRTTVTFTPNTLTATLYTRNPNGTRGGVVPTPTRTSVRGFVKISNVPVGSYLLVVSDSVPAGYSLWRRKGLGAYSGGTYTVTVAPGTRSRIVRIFEPAPVNVTFGDRHRVGDISWAVRNRDADGDDDRRWMLQPFPPSRAMISGFEPEYQTGARRCSIWNGSSRQYCLDSWGGGGRDGDRSRRLVTMRGVRPGLYSLILFRASDVGKKRETSFDTAREIFKWDRGVRSGNAYDYHWDGPRSRETASYAYLYVNTNGTVEMPDVGPNGRIVFPINRRQPSGTRRPIVPGHENCSARHMQALQAMLLIAGPNRWVWHGWSGRNVTVWPSSVHSALRNESSVRKLQKRTYADRSGLYTYKDHYLTDMSSDGNQKFDPYAEARWVRWTGRWSTNQVMLVNASPETRIRSTPSPGSIYTDPNTRRPMEFGARFRCGKGPKTTIGSGGGGTV